ncbi:MAG: ABC transporter permease [Ilumatobacter sp.]|uniref:ABC transporter permease n=1 Tax=Ilumatobacter sp. TaxID=1967498 RepID=UPI00262E97D1|nr:ABC transporter permease [Ilumatobacter sp.]MDJ0767728.1 ABC transporter permease [Ilumatobacter sp.]
MQSRFRSFALLVAAPVTSILFAFLLSSIVLLIAGSNPFTAYKDMVQHGTTLETVIDMLNKATPLYVSGVAAAIGFRMNLFNIGVEGQYQMGAFFAAAAGGAIVFPGFLHVIFIVVVAMIVGSLWAGLAGVLKVSRGVNEVISTIMLNNIALAGVLAWLTVAWRDGELSTNSGTKLIEESGWIFDLNWLVEIFTREILRGRELSGVLLIAILAGVAYHLFVSRSRLGFDLRASGYNPLAARASGVPPKRMVVLAMLLSGAAAGLVGLVDILSRNHRFDQNFTPGLGFAGIAVALLGRNHPVGIAVGALLFAFLDASSSILQITGSASKEIVTIMQGVILLAAVISYEFVRRIREREEVRLASLAIAGAEA